MADRIKGITIELNGDTTKLQSALKQVNTDISKTQTGLKDVNKLLKLDPGNTELLKQKQDLLNRAIEDTKKKLETEKEALNQLQNSPGSEKTREQQAALTREIVATEQELEKLTKQYKDFGSVSDQQLQAVGSKMQSVGSKMQSVGTGISSAGKSMLPVTAAITGIGAAAIKTTADFDAQMSKVSAISGAVGADFDTLRNKAREMGAATKFSAAESGEAFEYMAMAGWKTEDMVKGIDGVLALAAASGESLGTTSDIVTDAMTAFGLSADKAAHFADVLASTSSNANTNVSMMGETFKFCAPTAGALGYSIEDVSLAVGLMGNAGIKASQAGTSLNNLFTRMAKPTKESQEAMDRLGISLQDDEGKMYSFGEIINQLRDSFGEINMPIEQFNAEVASLESALASGEITQKQYDASLEELTKQAYGAEGAEKARAAAMLAGKTGMAGLLAIVNASEQDYNKLATAIGNCKDSAKNMAEIMNGNLNGQFTTLQSQLQELAISIGDAIMPAATAMVGVIQKIVDWLNSLDEGTKKTIVIIGTVVAAVAPVLMVIGGVVSAIGTIISAIGTVMGVVSTLMPAISGVVAVLGGPVTLTIAAVVAAVGTLIAIGVALYKNWDTIKEKLKVFADFMGKTWDAIKNAVSESVGKMKDMIQGKLDSVKKAYEENGGGVKGIVAATMTGLKEYYTLGFDAINTLTGGKLNAIKEKIDSAFAAILSTVTNIIDRIKSMVSGAIDALKSLIKLPHFRISGEFSLNPPSVPSLGVDWYAKAMTNGMILNNPTIFGAMNGKLLGAGEAGSEAIVGTNSLYNMIRSAVGSTPSVTMNVYGSEGQNVAELADIVSDRINSAINRKGTAWA